MSTSDYKAHFHSKLMMLIARYQHYKVGEVRHLLSVPDDPMTLKVVFIDNKGEIEAEFTPMMDEYVFTSMHANIEELIERKRIEQRERQQAEKLWKSLDSEQKKLLKKYFLAPNELA